MAVFLWRKTIKRDNAKGDKRPKINGAIKADQVMLIGAEGEKLGIMAIRDALTAAEEASLDLVQMSDEEPVVCKLQDYGKEYFEKKKRAKEAKRKQVRTSVKEMKFRPGTDIGDYNIKLRSLTKFLEHGDKVKVTLRFRGREMAHQQIGMDLLKRIETDLAELGGVEQFPKMEGRQLTMVIAPRKKK